MGHDGTGAMDDAGDADDFDWLREPLPERPDLRPLRRWASEHVARTLAWWVFGTAWTCTWLGLGRLGRSNVEVLVTLVLALYGLMGSIAALERLSRRRRAAACRRFPLEPWRHDRAWNDRGETRSWFVRAFVDRPSPAFWARWIWTVGVASVAALTSLGAWSAAAAVAVGLAASLAWRAWRIHGAGDSNLYFTKFPYHPGETVTLHFGMSEGGAQFRRVEFSLFHVREFKGGWLGMQRGTGAAPRGVERRPPGLLPGPDFDVEVSFDVPAEAPGTRLADDLPSYWVLDVRGVTSAGPYVERFLVPIYERPAPADPAA
jgi:hypothetical protein